MNGLLHASWLPAVGWALLHSLWEGTLVALAAALVLRGLRGASPRLRYAVAVFALLLMAALPIRHLMPLRSTASPVLLAQHRSMQDGPSFTQVLPAPSPALRTRMTEKLERGMPWVVLVWLAGACLSLLRLAGGWAWLQRLRWARAELAPDVLQSRLLELCRRAGLKRAVTLLTCDGLVGPSVVGVLRPAILVPAGWFLNLPPDQVEALLAHELAHVLRHDYAVNLLQSLLEVLLFYHPGVWWLSRRVRAERELACDTFAARLMGNPLPLAEALTTLERRGLGRTSLEPAPAAHGGSLMERITHLLLPPRRTSTAPAFGAMAVMVLVASGLQLAAQASESTPTQVPASPKQLITDAGKSDSETPHQSSVVQIRVQDKGLPAGYRVEFSVGAVLLSLPKKTDDPEDLKEHILAKSLSSYEVILRAGQTEGASLSIPLKTNPSEAPRQRTIVGLPLTYTIYDSGNHVVYTSTTRFHATAEANDGGQIVLGAKQNGLTPEGKPNIFVGTSFLEDMPSGVIVHTLKLPKSKEQ